METAKPADIQLLEDALTAAERDVHNLVSGLTAQQGSWRAEPRSWSVAQCLDHLTITNRVYLDAMRPSADRAVQQRRRRRAPAEPGVVGRWFVRTIEPPVRAHLKSPRIFRPRTLPSLADATAGFLASQEEVRSFLRRYADVDLAGVRFPNPFIPSVRFSLATGLHVIAAHERRHLWQAWRVRDAAERSAAVQSAAGA